MILKICRIKAREKAEGQLQELYETALKEVGESGAAIFEVHQMMMEDEDYCSSVENMITQQQVNAEYAVAVTGDSFSSMFAEIDILARTMGIPAIIAVPIQKEWHGKMVIMDGYKGERIINPDEEQVKEAKRLDLGADKQAGYFELDEEENPALGYHAIRICLTRPGIVKTQFRALLRASSFGNISIMIPMIISIKEIQKIKEIFEEVKYICLF